MTAPVSFRQSDVTRLIKGALKAGCDEDALKLTVAPDGSLSLAIQRPSANDDEPEQWDDA